MKLLFSSSDIKYHFKQNSKIYFMLFLCAVVGLIIGGILVTSSERVLELNSEDNLIANYILGDIVYSKQVWRMILKFVLSMLIIFAACLNIYSSVVAFLFLSYQSVLLFLSLYSLVIEFGVVGILNIIFFVLPINFVYFAVMIFFTAICFRRCYEANRNKNFAFGFCSEYFFKIALSFGFCVIFSILVNFLLMILLKCNIFIIF